MLFGRYSRTASIGCSMLPRCSWAVHSFVGHKRCARACMNAPDKYVSKQSPKSHFAVCMATRPALISKKSRLRESTKRPVCRKMPKAPG